MILKYLFKLKKMYSDITELQRWSKNVNKTLSNLSVQLSAIEKIKNIEKQVAKIDEMLKTHSEVLNDIASEKKKQESEKQKKYDEFISGFEAIQKEIWSFAYPTVMKLLSEYFYFLLKNEESKDLMNQIKQNKDYDFDNVLRRINDFTYKQKAIEEDRGSSLCAFVINPAEDNFYDERFHNNIDMRFDPLPNSRTVIKDTIIIGIKFPDDFEFNVKPIKAAVICKSVPNI